MNGFVGAQFTCRNKTNAIFGETPLYDIDDYALFELPLTELVFRAAEVHRAHHDPIAVQRSTLLSIKTGGCPEDCGYCSQSVHADSGLKATKLMDVQAVLQAAAQAKDHGSTRFCMGAAWRNPKDKDLPALARMIAGVRAMGWRPA